MELRDMNNQSVKKINKLLESRYGFVLDYDKMTPARAQEILSVINESLKQVKNSSAAHTAHKDPRYMEMLMVKESVSKYMKDYKPENGPGQKKAPKMKAVKAAVTGRSAISEMAKGKNYQMITRAVELASQGKAVPGKYMEAFVPLFQQLAKRKLTEGELGKSEVVLAAKDMVDTLQDMIEDLSRMVNEELPQMMDGIRDQIGTEQADSFGTSVTATLNTLLDSVRDARGQMDTAARTLAGEQMPAPMEMPGADAGVPGAEADPMADMGSDFDAEEDPFAAADAAQGGASLAGREQR